MFTRPRKAAESASAAPTAAPAHQIKTHPLAPEIVHHAAVADIRESAILALNAEYISKNLYSFILQPKAERKKTVYNGLFSFIILKILFGIDI